METKDKKIIIRVTADQKRRIEEKAQKQELSISAFMLISALTESRVISIEELEEIISRNERT